MPTTTRQGSADRRWTPSTRRDELESAHTETRPPLVLLAEDDEDMRRLIARSLRADGFEVIEACGGIELLGHIDAMLQSSDGGRAVDVIVSDVRMPGRSGLQVLGRLRRSDWSVPVILITAFGDEGLHAEAARLGAAAVLDKPFDLHELRRLTRAVVAP